MVFINKTNNIQIELKSGIIGNLEQQPGLTGLIIWEDKL